MARKPPSAVIHNDNSVIRHTNHIFNASGVEGCHLDRTVVRERHWRITGGVVAQSRQIPMNDCTALAQELLGVPYQSWMIVRNDSTSFLLKLINAGKPAGTSLLLVGESDKLIGYLRLIQRLAM